ncbi:MAG: hypothetical protein JO202_10530 [Ktedonobacteraceae bacterium]|nr:hypothetical protein [Ktedonobacteraceae bacterium]
MITVDDQIGRASAGCAGWYPSSSMSSPPLWKLLPVGQRSPIEGGPAILYQRVLNPFFSFFSAHASCSFRVTVCGLLHHCDGLHFGDNLLLLVQNLQLWLDERGSFPQSVKELDGDFLLCYVPPEASCCWLYRHVTGMRALYYRSTPHGFQWSTSVTDFFVEKPSISDVDHDRLAVASAYGDPERTWYREVNCLPAGHGLQLHPDGRMVSFCQDFVITEQSLTLYDAAFQLRHLLAQAIQRKLRGFPSIGVLLSGGLDSAVIAREACQLSTRVQGLHWTWDLPIFEDERSCAYAVAEYLHILLHEVDGSAALTEAGDLVRCMQGLPLPFHHSFYHAFRASAQMAGLHNLSAVVSGHLGDLLFHGEWLDGFRAPLTANQWNPLMWVNVIGNLLSWYSRDQAVKVGFRLLTGQRHMRKEPLAERLVSCQVWLTAQAFEQVQASGDYTYKPTRSAFSTNSTYQTYQYLKQKINNNTNLDTILVDHAFLPQQVQLLHPYADKTLIEFCLGLGPLHRMGFAAGMPLSKVLLRYAYLEKLPPQIIGREARVPYIAVNRTYCQHNQRELAEIFGKHSCLAQLGVINPEAITQILAEPAELQRHSGSLIPAAAVELWLRHLSNMPLLSVPVPSPHAVVLPEAFLNRQYQQTGVAKPATNIVTKEIGGAMILLNSHSQEVIQLSRDASTLLVLFFTTSSWEEVLTIARQLWQDTTSDQIQKQTQTLVLQLTEGGWIRLRKPLTTGAACNEV